MILVLVVIWLMLGVFVTYHKTDSDQAPADTRHWMGFSSREARLAQRVREGEDQVQWLKLQLANTQKRMSQVRGEGNSLNT